jgi:hypothetical protein
VQRGAADQGDHLVELAGPSRGWGHSAGGRVAGASASSAAERWAEADQRLLLLVLKRGHLFVKAASGFILGGITRPRQPRCAHDAGSCARWALVRRDLFSRLLAKPFRHRREALVSIRGSIEVPRERQPLDAHDGVGAVDLGGADDVLRAARGGGRQRRGSERSVNFQGCRDYSL